MKQRVAQKDNKKKQKISKSYEEVDVVERHDNRRAYRDTMHTKMYISLSKLFMIIITVDMEVFSYF